MYIPDPIELMEMRIERMMDDYDEGKCMFCGNKGDYDLISATSAPDSPAVCFECLSDEAQAAYIKFENQNQNGI